MAERAACAKCGAVDLVTRWCARNRWTERDVLTGEITHKVHDTECLHRLCRVCGYAWSTPCLS